jgi:hypothetical protein
MPERTKHTKNAHGLVIGDLTKEADSGLVHGLVRDFVIAQDHVVEATTVVSLFEDNDNHGQPGDTIAAQVDLDIPATNPAAHQILEGIKNHMSRMPAPNGFKPNSVKHY